MSETNIETETKTEVLEIVSESQHQPESHQEDPIQYTATEQQKDSVPIEKVFVVDLSQIHSNMNESVSPVIKEDFIDELNHREDEIRKMLQQSNPDSDRSSSMIERLKQRGVKYGSAKHTHTFDDEEYNFQPKLSSGTKKIMQKQGVEQPSAGEALYKAAVERQIKSREQEAEVKERAAKDANSQKINATSVKIMLKKIENTIRFVIASAEDASTKGKISFEGLIDILNKIGVLHSINKKEQENNEDNTAISQDKAKIQRLQKEVVFQENFWKILNVSADDEKSISSETVFRFLMVLVEDKTPVSENSALLQEIMSYELQSNGIAQEEAQTTFAKFKEEKELWDFDKLVSEFRKLFSDRSTFMSIYNSVNPSPLRSTYVASKSELTFKPQINANSQTLAMKRAQGGYEDKVKVASELRDSPNKPQTRYDILFEHHRYIKEKKNEIIESRKDKELENCTFKPTIREYKIKPPKETADFDLSDFSSPYSTFTYTSSSKQTLNASKRHDLLYEVGRAQKEKMKQKVYELQKQKEEKELAECTFQPKIKSLKEESPSKFKALQSDPPKGYEKAVERLQIAEKIREIKKIERERIPCGENYERLRNTKFQPPTLLSRNKVKKEELLVYVDVNISPGKTGRIGIHKGSDAKKLAKNFSKTYSLPPVMKDSLSKLLQSYIDTYFPDTGNSHEIHQQVIEVQAEAEENYDEEERYQNLRGNYGSNHEHNQEEYERNRKHIDYEEKGKHEENERDEYVEEKNHKQTGSEEQENQEEI